MDYVSPRDGGLPRIERDQSTRFPPPPASRGGGVPRLSAEYEPTVSILADLPEDLHDELRVFLDEQTDWDTDRIFTVAIAQFLMQQSFAEVDTRTAARQYLANLWGGEGVA